MTKLHRVILFFSVFCLYASIYNIVFISDFYPAYLIWNLFLAAIPYLLAIYFEKSIKRKKSKWKWVQRLLLLTWLVFFPNTMYMVTDFVHLYEQTYLPVWFDIVQIFSYTWLAFLFGFLSLYKVERVLNKKLGPSRSMGFVILSIVLASIGMYLGRYLRWNSWDVFIQPWSVVADFGRIFTHWYNFVNFIGMVCMFSGMFMGVYFSFRALLHSKEKEI